LLSRKHSATSNTQFAGQLK